MKEYKLKIPKNMDGLADFKYGEEIFNKSIVSEFKEDMEPIKIVFPNEVISVASSFVQGFFSTLAEDFGYDWIKEKIIIETSSDSLTQSIIDRLY